MDREMDTTPELHLNLDNIPFEMQDDSLFDDWGLFEEVPDSDLDWVQ